jgi:hypothetical protein
MLKKHAEAMDRQSIWGTQYGAHTIVNAAWNFNRRQGDDGLFSQELHLVAQETERE